jgi:hypothetical protein
MIGWLISFDTEGPYDPREASELARVKCGDRTDYWWARVSPRIERGEAGNSEPLDIVLLAPRHSGDSLDIVPVRRPLHVYVCTVKRVHAELPTVVDPDDVVIRHWGVLYPSREMAETAATADLSRK